MRRRRLLLLVVSTAVAAVVAIGLGQASRSDRSPQPPLSTPDAAEIRARFRHAPPALAALHRQADALLSGGRDGLLARLRALRGHPVVINVWAAWCGPCRDELPVLQRASVAWGSRVAFIGVDLRDDRASAERLLQQIPVSYPSFEDPDGSVARAYGLVGTPSTIYYDKAGRTTHVHPGPYLERGQLDADIARYAIR